MLAFESRRCALEKITKRRVSGRVSPNTIVDLRGYEKARQEIRKSNFALSFLFLQPESRTDLETFYVFCRVVDDIVDETRDRSEARERLAFWEGLFQGDTMALGSHHPLAVSLDDLIRRRDIPVSLFREIVAGMSSDLDHVRIPDVPALKRYCYLAAGAVGRVCIPIFGGSIARLGPYADRLGEAFQLTNILRDLKGDAERDRIYLPADRMAHFGVTEADVLDGNQGRGFVRLLEELWEIADRDYREAEDLLDEPSLLKTMEAARAMSVFYRDIHKTIRRKRFDVYRDRIRLSPFRKFRLLAGFWLSSRVFPGWTARRDGAGYV